MRKSFLLVLVLALAALAVAHASAAPEKATRSIAIVKASDDHGIIRLTVRITGWRGRWNIYVNGRYNNSSTSRTRGSTDPKRKFASGSYRLYAALANADRTLLRPVVRSRTVTVTVEEPAETTETTE
jgi:opacity protein-like surface antigen